MGWNYDESIETLHCYCDRCLIAKETYSYMSRKKCFQLMRIDGFKFVEIRGQRRLLCANCVAIRKAKYENKHL